MQFYHSGIDDKVLWKCQFNHCIKVNLISKFPFLALLMYTINQIDPIHVKSHIVQTYTYHTYYNMVKNLPNKYILFVPKEILALRSTL